MKFLSVLFLLAATLAAQVAPTPVPVGRKAIFSSSVEGGTLPFTYVWYKNNTPIAGETSSSLTIESVTGDSAGTYKVRVSNSVGFVDSNEITITVPQAPIRATISLSILP